MRPGRNKLCELSLADEENAAIPSALADARLQRLLTIGQQINALRSKISLATKYIGTAGTAGDAEDVVLAREALRRDLERDFGEARELMPIVDKLVSKFEEQIKSLENTKKVHEGLAKIEELSGATGGRDELEAAASKDRARIYELENLISALDDLGRDITMKKEVVACPRCSSHRIAYRITPSEMGFSLYRCNICGNAWRTIQFSMQVGSPTR